MEVSRQIVVVLDDMPPALVAEPNRNAGDRAYTVGHRIPQAAPWLRPIALSDVIHKRRVR